MQARFIKRLSMPLFSSPSEAGGASRLSMLKQFIRSKPVYGSRVFTVVTVEKTAEKYLRETGYACSRGTR